MNRHWNVSITKQNIHTRTQLVGAASGTFEKEPALVVSSSPAAAAERSGASALPIVPRTSEDSPEFISGDEPIASSSQSTNSEEATQQSTNRSSIASKRARLAHNEKVSLRSI